MTAKDIVTELKNRGTEQTKKMWMTHGAQEAYGGVKVEEMKMTKKNLQKWVENATWGMVAEYTVPWVASASPHGREMALKWMDSKNEAIASAGWGTYSSLVAIQED